MLNMDRSSFQYFVAFSLLLIMLCFFNMKGSYGKLVGCIESEREALLHFKGGVLDDFGILSSWGNIGEDKTDCCINWRGVECDNYTGHVISLDLHGQPVYELGHQYLGGKIGTSLGELQHLKYLNLSSNSFEGILPTQLGNLSNLQSLDLSYNSFEGSLPAQLGNLSSLQSLDLSWNHFHGILPTQLGNLSNLLFLDLSRNVFIGVLPPQLENPYNFQLLHLYCENLDWLSGLPLLRELDLSGVNLSKAIHWSQAISKTSSLTELHLRNTQLPTIIYSSEAKSISYINSSTSVVVLDLSSNNLTPLIYPWLFNFMSNNNVVHLDLSFNNLNGSIPDAFGNISTTLAYLHLSANQLEGEIPKFFNNISCLVDLDLSQNQLRGSIPDAFANMVSLESLDLSHNYLEGEIPLSLRDLCNLHELHLSDNNLSGLLEKDFLACSNNTLEVLDLSNNSFRGTSFPHFSGFSQLRELYLGFNQLNGTLPESIGQLPQLQFLSIPSNSLQGSVSENHLFGLSKLWWLDLSYNSKLTFNISLEQVPEFQAHTIRLASCKLGPRFPNWLRTQKRFMALDISASGISDVIPIWFWNLTMYPVWLNISNNHISGTLPNLTSYPHNLGMDMSSNRLEGSMPKFVFAAPWLDLSNNMFSGSISSSCGVINPITGLGMSHLDLSSNRLSGEIPAQCWNRWERLIVLNLANNNFSGKIENSIGLLYRMQTLHLRNNSFAGALPSFLKNCSDLHLMDLGKNKLSGRIPAWIGDSLPNLVVLNLRSNEFNGTIPLNLCQLKMIQMLDLSSNHLWGRIPKCLKNLTAMAQKGSPIIAYDEMVYNSNIRTYYVDNTLVQWKGKELEYKNTLRLVKSIDFSSNKLVGEIPVQVTDLVELVSLNLSRNNLIGPIPTTIGRLKSLDFLDLSQNKLSGGIPSSLAQIAGLSILDLSNNTLSGKIPSGTQLQSFNASTYEGNPKLCGPPLSKRCPEDKSKEHSFIGLSSEEDDIQDGANNILFYGNIVLGFIIGFWGVCGTLVLHSSWRYAYFKFLNKIKDRLHETTTTNMNRLRRSFQT